MPIGHGHVQLGTVDMGLGGILADNYGAIFDDVMYMMI